MPDTNIDHRRAAAVAGRDQDRFADQQRQANEKADEQAEAAARSADHALRQKEVRRLIRHDLADAIKCVFAVAAKIRELSGSNEVAEQAVGAAIAHCAQLRGEHTASSGEIWRTFAFHAIWSERLPDWFRVRDEEA